MRALRLVPALLVASLLSLSASACGSDSDHPATAKATPTTTTTSPGETTTAPPPANETGAVSRDTQAKLTAEGAVKVVDACFAKTHDYLRCTTDQLDSQLAIYPAAAWGNEPGQVSIQGTPSGYLIDSHSYSGAEFVIQQSAGAEPVRTCGESESECDAGTW